VTGEFIPIKFSYLLDFDMKNFKISFVSELRKQFKDKNIFFDQIKLYYNGNNYNFDYIVEDKYIFDVFIDDDLYDKYNLTKEEIDYYENSWEGEEFKSYLIWFKKSNISSLFHISTVYCGTQKKYFMFSTFTEKDFKTYLRKTEEDNEELEFADDISYLRYIYETGKTTIY
jgi:hypothetical protein